MCAILAAGCFGGGRTSGPPILGENFPPYDIAFASYAAPLFPRALRASGVANGYSVVVVTVGTDGRVGDAIALEASHPAFADAVLEAAASWVFAPVRAETTPRREVLHYVFRRSGVATGLTHLEGAKAAFIESNDQPLVQTVAYADLATPPQRLAGTPPVPVDAELEPGETGSAVVSFVIDQDGYVRVPAVTATTDAALGTAALEAVKTWRFEPTLRRGSRVLVEAVHTFTFTGTSSQ